MNKEGHGLSASLEVLLTRVYGFTLAGIQRPVILDSITWSYCGLYKSAESNPAQDRNFSFDHTLLTFIQHTQHGYIPGIDLRHREGQVRNQLDGAHGWSSFHWTTSNACDDNTQKGPATGPFA